VRAAVYYGRQDVRIEEAPDRGAPGPGELLLDVRLAGICGTDVGEFLLGPGVIPVDRRHPGSGHLGPMIIGHEFLGTVSEMGPGVEGFAIGDRVVSGAGVSCGECPFCLSGRTNLCVRYYTIGLHSDGGLADQVIAAAPTCRLVPEGCDDLSAVLAQPLAIAFHAAGRSGSLPGERMLVIGAGAIGSFIIAASTQRELGELIAVDIDEARLENARALGADRVLQASDGVAALGADVVVEATGTEAGLNAAFAAVRDGGRVLIVGMHDEPRSLDLRALTVREVEIMTTNAHICALDLPDSLEHLADGTLARRVIDRVVPLEAVVDEGLVAMAEGRVGGKVVVDVAA
jgi:threonine dehydrogenase-like Zn-dependent dehydrogenase